MFFCAAIFELDRMGDSMTLWMGGMNDILALTKADCSIDKIESMHMPIGILDDEEFDDSPAVVMLENYSQLFIYTDGIPEAQNQEQEEFGEDRLAEIIVSQPEDPIASILDSVHAFTSESEQSDDVSILQVLPGAIVHRSKDDDQIVDVGEDYHLVDSIPWHLSMKLYDNDLKSTNVVEQVLSFVSSIKGIELHQDKIFTIVSELYNNSLEHGVLRLSSDLKDGADGFELYYNTRQERLAALKDQCISINFRYITGSPNKLELVIEDSGDGFDLSVVEKKLASDEDSHGRGLSLLKHLCANLEYSNQGRTVTAVYELRQH